jgi:hypothetical protein
MKNSRLIKSLLELELVLGTEIQRQWEEYQHIVNNPPAEQIIELEEEKCRLDLMKINSILRTFKGNLDISEKSTCTCL